MKITHNRQHASYGVSYFMLREGPSVETREIVRNLVYADYNAEGLLVGVETLGLCEEAEIPDFIEPRSAPARVPTRTTAALELLFRYIDQLETRCLPLMTQAEQATLFTEFQNAVRD